MQWYVSTNGQTRGPIEASELLEQISAGEVGRDSRVRCENSEQWIPIEDSPFTEFVTTAEAKPAAQTERAPMSGGLKLFLSLMAFGILTRISAWLGLAIGIWLICWGISAQRKYRRSFVPWILQRRATQGLNLATVCAGMWLTLCSTPGLVAPSDSEALETEQQSRAGRASSAADTQTAALQQQERELPTRLSEWTATIDQILATVGSPDSARFALASELDAVIEAANDYQIVLRRNAPNELQQLRVQVADVKQKLAARKLVEDALRGLEHALGSATDARAKRDWLVFDSASVEALEAIATLEKREPWLDPFLPDSLDLAARKSELEQTRRRFASRVSAAKAKAEHQARVEKIDEVTASLVSGDHESYQRARSTLVNELEECGRCRARTALTKALKEVERQLAKWPIELSSLQELQVRYADLKGRLAQVKGRLRTSTYYNCRFRSSSKWRSFTFSDGLLGLGGVHLYCARGNESCEVVFQKLASGTSERGTAIVEYPKSNSICEEGQARLRGWTPSG